MRCYEVGHFLRVGIKVIFASIRKVSSFSVKYWLQRAEICVGAGVMSGFFTNFAVRGRSALTEMAAQWTHIIPSGVSRSLSPGGTGVTS